MNIKRLVFSPIEENTYVLSDSMGNCVIIDCGCYDEAEFEILKGYISENKLKPLMLLNTHLHLDHVFGNRFVLAEYGLKTHASKEEEHNLQTAPISAEMFGLNMPEPPGIENYLVHGQVIEAGEISLECIFVPGHTAGSIAFYSKEENCVFTGDALFNGSIGRTDLPGGDHSTLLKSIRDNLLSLPEATVVYPGHGEKTSIGFEKENNPFLV